MSKNQLLIFIFYNLLILKVFIKIYYHNLVVIHIFGLYTFAQSGLMLITLIASVKASSYLLPLQYAADLR